MNQMIRSSYRPPYFYINRGPDGTEFEPFIRRFKDSKRNLNPQTLFTNERVILKNLTNFWKIIIK
jgi:hypothetical protein